jgi:hypothetical protein
MVLESLLSSFFFLPLLNSLLILYFLYRYKWAQYYFQRFGNSSFSSVYATLRFQEMQKQINLPTLL